MEKAKKGDVAIFNLFEAKMWEAFAFVDQQCYEACA